MRSPFAWTLPAVIRRSRELLLGVRNNFAFSNGLQLTLQRLVRRDAPEVVYVWRNRVRIACDCRRQEHFGVHEVFTHQCYAPGLARCQFPANRIAFVDIGANVGAFDLWLWSRGLEIDFGLAAELNPLTCRRCARNLQANGLGMVHVVNCAVAGREGWIDFVPSPHALGDSIFSPASVSSRARGPAPMRVELVTLATLVERYARSRGSFDLLKMDCEGAEYGILRTASIESLRAFRYLLVEFHAPPPDESLPAALLRLREIGFAPQSAPTERLPFIALFVRL